MNAANNEITKGMKIEAFLYGEPGVEVTMLIEREDGARFIYLGDSGDGSEGSEAPFQRAIDKINAGAALNAELWRETDPVYGSERHAYRGDSHLLDANERHMRDFGTLFEY